MKLTSDKLYAFFEKELKNKQAFSLDWKFSAEDTVFNIKEIIPDLNISCTHATQIYGEWVEKVTINDTEYSFNIESETLIIDLIRNTNQHIAAKNQTLVTWDYLGDEYNFILIKLDKLPEYEEMGFYRI